MQTHMQNVYAKNFYHDNHPKTGKIKKKKFGKTFAVLNKPLQPPIQT